MHDKTLVHIRWWTGSDDKQVLDMHSRNNGKLAEDKKYFSELLKERGVIGCVAVKADFVLGFVIYELFEKRLDILHLEVDEAWRRRGVGTQLFNSLVAKLAEHRREAVTMKVRETDMQAQLFLRSMGAKCIKVIRGFYETAGEDAFLFSYTRENLENKAKNSVFEGTPLENKG